MTAPRASTRSEELLVVCLCAAWCYVCNDFRAAISVLARAHPNISFVWVDIEDDSALVGDVDIENFPTLAVFRGDTPLFYGVTPPQAPVISHTLASLYGAQARAVAVPEQVAVLPQVLRGRKREAPA